MQQSCVANPNSLSCPHEYKENIFHFQLCWPSRKCRSARDHHLRHGRGFRRNPPILRKPPVWESLDWRGFRRNGGIRAILEMLCCHRKDYSNRENALACPRGDLAVGNFGNPSSCLITNCPIRIPSADHNPHALSWGWLVATGH